MQRKHRGPYSELIASAWLLEHGYEVFKNQSDRGPMDLVAFKGGEFLLIDVKTALMRVGKKGNISFRHRGNGALTDEQTTLGVRALYVTPDGVCDWHLQRLADLYNSFE